MEKLLLKRQQNILFALKQSLALHKITIRQLTKKIFGIPKQYLNHSQFQKIVKFGDFKLTFQQIDSLFLKVQSNQNVTVEQLQNTLKTLTEHKKQTQIKIQTQNTIKIVDIKEILKYISDVGPYEVFDLFDLQKDGFLDATELNNFLMKASQTLNKKKQDRFSLLKFMLEKQSNNIINIDKFLAFFGLEYQPKRVLFNEPPEMMKVRSDAALKEIYLKNKKGNKSNSTFGIGKLQILKNQESKKFFEPTPPQNYSYVTNALQYYRLKQKYIQIMEIIQNYLRNKQIFEDLQNPKTNNGSYVHASKIFKGKFGLMSADQLIIEQQKDKKQLGLQFQAKDVIQGFLGNCYFLSSLSCVVDKYPQLVSNYFMFNINPSGIYAVRLFNDGQWSNIILDDRFPCIGVKPVYAKPNGNQIWAMLLEKAWAKLHGSYENIGLGSSHQAFVALTGAPCKYIKYQQQKQSQMKSLILQGFSKNGMITCGSSDRLNLMSKQETDKIGLVANHAYSLHAILKFITPDTREEIQIIKIRNPWGNLEWKGDWSFSSKKWTSELQQKYNYTKNPGDGSFYIDWNNFLKYFSNITVCYLQPSFVNSAIKLNVNRHQPKYITFRIKKSGNYVFTIYQQSKRKYMYKGAYELSQSSMVIAKQSNQDFLFIKSGCKTQSNLCVQDTFQEGVYIVKLMVKWNYFDSHQCTLTSYGPEPIVFQQIAGTNIQPQFISDTISGFSRKYPGDISNYSEIGISDAIKHIFFSIQYGFGYIKIKNSSQKQFTTKIVLKQSSGLKLLEIFKQPLQATMSPGSQKLFGFQVSAKGFNYSLQEQLQFKI